MIVYVLLRYEEENARRVFPGVYRTRPSAEAAVDADVDEYGGLYNTDDYDLIETTMED